MKKWTEYSRKMQQLVGVEKLKQLLKEGKIKKSQLALVVLSIGAIVFLSLPNQSKTNASKREKSVAKTNVTSNAKTSERDSETDYICQKEKELEQLLRQVKGVGEVRVMITLKDNGEQKVNKDISTSHQNELGVNADSKEQESYQEQTVLLENGDRDQSVLVTRQLQPEIMGVVVICEGGDNPQVVSEVSCAVQVLFSVSAHKVKVMKKIC